MKNKFETNFKENGLTNASFVVIEKESGTAVHDVLTHYINSEQPNFVVCAPDPQLERVDLLSVSERIVKNAKTNVILYKVPSE